MEIPADLGKKMSISGDLGTGDLVADKVSDQFRTVESSRQLCDEADKMSRGHNQKVAST